MTGPDCPRLIRPDRVRKSLGFLGAPGLETLVWPPEGRLTQLPGPCAGRWRDA